jgi:tRNA-dihydrouridine synthase B
VMIGRMAPANPWIFRQIEQYVSCRPSAVSHQPSVSELDQHKQSKFYDEPTEADRYQMIRTYFQMLLEEEMPGAEGKMKQFASWFTHGVSGGATLRKAIYDAKSGMEILANVESFFEPRVLTSPAT